MTKELILFKFFKKTLNKYLSLFMSVSFFFLFFFISFFTSLDYCIHIQKVISLDIEAFFHFLIVLLNFRVLSRKLHQQFFVCRILFSCLLPLSHVESFSMMELFFIFIPQKIQVVVKTFHGNLIP
jgi:hypothetical protein